MMTISIMRLMTFLAVPLLVLTKIIRGLIERVIIGFAALRVMLVFLVRSFLTRTVRAVRKIMTVLFISAQWLVKTIVQLGVYIAALILRSIIFLSEVILAIIQRIGDAVLAVAVSIFSAVMLMVRLTVLAFSVVYRSMRRAWAAITDTVIRMVRRLIAIMIVALRAIRKIVLKVASVFFQLMLSVLVRVRHALVIIAAALSYLGARLMVVALMIVGAAKSAARMMIMAFTALLRMLAAFLYRILRAILGVGWTLIRTLQRVMKAVYQLISLLIIKIKLAVGWIVRAVAVAFFRIGVLLWNAFVYPAKRTGTAFQRIAVALSMGVILVATIVSTGLYTILVKLSIPLVHFLMRNLVAYHRIALTFFMGLVKVWTLLVAAVAYSIRFLVHASVTVVRMTIAGFKAHWLGIRDITLIFSPSVFFGVLYLVLGGFMFLLAAVLYIAVITASSYAYNKFKGDNYHV